MDLSKFNTELKFADFCKINNNLTSFQKYSISAAVSNSVFIEGIDRELFLFSTLKNELTQNVYKNILRDLFKSKNVDFFDASPYGGIDTQNCPRSLGDKIISQYPFYKNIVTNSKLGSVLQDCIEFSWKSSSVNLTTSSDYPIGNFNNLGLYVDPYMRWDDDMMCFFDEVEINVQGLSIEIIAEATFAPRLKLDFNMDYRIVGNPSVLYVIEDSHKNTNAYNLFLTQQRDEKIDLVIGEDKTKNPLF